MSGKKHKRRRKQRTAAERQQAFERRREVQRAKASNPPAPPTGLRLLRKLLKDPILGTLAPAIVAAPITIFVGIVDHLALTTFLLLCEKCGGVLALLSGLFQIGNSGWRIHLKHWTSGGYLRRRLLQELLVGGLMPLVIAAVALLFEPSMLTALMLPLVFALVSFIYEPIEKAIYVEVARLGLRHGTEDVAAIHGLGEQLKGSTTLLRKTAAWLLHREPGKLSRMRRIVIAATTVALFVSVFGAVAAFGALFTGHVPLVPAAPLSHPNRTHGDGKQTRHHKLKQTSSGAHHERTETRQTGSGQGTGTSPSPSLTWEDVCPTEPGYDAPQWVHDALYALYLGRVENADPPPGALQGGCTSATQRVDSPAGMLYFTIGKSIDSGQTLSVAVVSARYGSAIFLSPAPKLVLSLLSQGPLGGEPRQNVGNGDFYLLHNAEGVTVLLRRTKTISTTSTLAEPYVELPPAVAQAWFQAMRGRALEQGDATHAWLWPVEAVLPDGTEQFQLLDATTGSPVAVINFDPTAGSARLKNGSSSVSFAPPNSNFTVSDLKPFMLLPPPPPTSPPTSSGS